MNRIPPLAFTELLKKRLCVLLMNTIGVHGQFASGRDCVSWRVTRSSVCFRGDPCRSSPCLGTLPLEIKRRKEREERGREEREERNDREEIGMGEARAESMNQIRLVGSAGVVDSKRSTRYPEPGATKTTTARSSSAKSRPISRIAQRPCSEVVCPSAQTTTGDRS